MLLCKNQNRERLLLNPAPRHFAMPAALTWLRSSGRQAAHTTLSSVVKT